MLGRPDPLFFTKGRLRQTNVHLASGGNKNHSLTIATGKGCLEKSAQCTDEQRPMTQLNILTNIEE